MNTQAAMSRLPSPRPQLLTLIGTGGHDGLDIDGNPVVLATLTGLTDQPDPSFAVVAP